MTPYCVLRSGGDFLPEHVQRLASQVPGLVCLSDVPVSGVPCIPLESDWPGWWAKMEAFSPRIKGDVLLIDLDTTVIRIPEMPSETTVLKNFYRPWLIGSGFMLLKEEDRERVWNNWVIDPEDHMRRCQTNEVWGDQGYLLPFFGTARKWGRNVVSYKLHCRYGIPKRADVVCFHGKPRPWDIGVRNN